MVGYCYGRRMDKSIKRIVISLAVVFGSMVFTATADAAPHKDPADRGGPQLVRMCGKSSPCLTPIPPGPHIPSQSGGSPTGGV
jgi:hypothetical protein